MEQLRLTKTTADQIPIPICVINPKGKITGVNEKISEVFLYDEIEDYDFFALTGIRNAQLQKTCDEETPLMLDRNGKKFRLVVTEAPFDEEGNGWNVFFYDVTEKVNLKKEYEASQVCVARVDIDNYDELKANTEPETQLSITSAADKIIRQWAARLKGPIDRISSNSYLIYFEHRMLDMMLRNKFALLDEVRKIETTADFPVTLSIGVGAEGGSIPATRGFAEAAMDLAHGRGGDQAVMKRGSKIEYFGGKLQTVEKGNKGKSRVIAHALSRLITEAEKIMIMGHRNADMDSFGSSLGMFRFCQQYGMNASIVISTVNDSLQTIYRMAKDTDNYTLMDREQALNSINKDTLLIVLDTHRPSYVDTKELLERTDHIVVIDHHRRSADAIKNPTLAYIESYASSTSELVTEMLQYTDGSKKKIAKLEAEALLAGIMVDTNRFAVKTGIRTFEAAAWLRRAGADTAEVKKLFQSDLEDFKVRSAAIAAASIDEKGIATSICQGFNQEAQVINSQVADELLNVKGVRASFVAGRNETGNTVVSARSLGDINVQVIMEKMGGGGHLTTAGTQTDSSPQEVLAEIHAILYGEDEKEISKGEGSRQQSASPR